MSADLTRRATAEGVGTAMLLAAVVGSGVMGERLAGGNVAIALLANTVATGAALVVLIPTFGPISGAHLNPAVTIADATLGGIAWRRFRCMSRRRSPARSLASRPPTLMFALPIYFSVSARARGPAQAFSEFMATFGLLAVIWGCSRRRPDVTPPAVGLTSRRPTGSPPRPPSRIPRSPRASRRDTFAGIAPGRRPRLHRRPDARRDGRDLALPLARSSAVERSN